MAFVRGDAGVVGASNAAADVTGEDGGGEGVEGFDLGGDVGLVVADGVEDVWDHEGAYLFSA